MKRFLLDHLIAERNLSRNTQQSYRDTLALLLPYAGARKKTPVEVFDLSSDVLRRFLDHLEQDRRCSIRTRNQRLAAIHALARFIAERSPEHIAWCSQIRLVPFKRFIRNELSYLDKPEMDAIIAAPDRRTELSRRDHALLLFLYNSGARVSEAATLLIGDLNLRPNQIGDVQLRGKGRKIRRCPLWPATTSQPRESWKNEKGDYENRTEWHRVYAWRISRSSPRPSRRGSSSPWKAFRYREVEDEVEGTTFKHRISEVHAITMKRLSKVEAADDPTDGAGDE